MPSNSGKEECTDVLQNICREKKLNLEAMSYKFIEEERSQPPKNLVTHIWFLWPYRHIMIVKEYAVGQPEINPLSTIKSFITPLPTASTKSVTRGRPCSNSSVLPEPN